MRNPEIKLPDKRAGQIIFKKIFVAVNHGGIPRISDLEAKGLNDRTQLVDGKGILVGILHIVRNRVVEVASVQILQACVCLRRGFGGVRRLGVNISAYLDSVLNGARIVVLEFCIFRVVRTLADKPQHGELYAGARDGGPVDVALVSGNVDPPDRNLRFGSGGRRRAGKRQRQQQRQK